MKSDVEGDVRGLCTKREARGENSPPFEGGVDAPFRGPHLSSNDASEASQSSPPESGGETREARWGGSITAILTITRLEPPRLRFQRWLRGIFLGGAATPPNLGGEFLRITAFLCKAVRGKNK